MLIYETAVPVSANRHSDANIEALGDYAFSRDVNAVPLMAVEFPAAAAEYAIVFTGEDNVMPAAILGMRGKQNLYLDDAGKWQAKYLPAFIRRYPFVFSASADNQTFTLCVDESYGGFNKDGRGQALFADGKATPYVDNVLKFLQEYQAQFQRTQAFCKKLKELDLFEPMQAQVTLAGGGKLSLTGFMAVDRKKLKALTGEQLAELAKNDGLELLYLHLYSMRNFAAIKDRLALVESGQVEGGKADDAAKAPAQAAAG
jgi:hypothetical protein